MLAGKLVKLSGARDFVEHVRKLCLAAHCIGKSLHLHNKFGVLNLVEGTGAIGQLNTALESAVAPACYRKLPVPAVRVGTFHSKRLAAHTACCGHRRQGGFARHIDIQHNRRDHINQCVQSGLLLGHQRGAQGTERCKARVLVNALVKNGFAPFLKSIPWDKCARSLRKFVRWLRLQSGREFWGWLFGFVFSGRPRAVYHQQRQKYATGDRQSDLKRDHAASSAIPILPE